MLTCISQIAWAPEEHEQALALLKKHGITQIEIAPSMLFSQEMNPFRPSKKAIKEQNALLQSFGLTPVSMQALLYNLPQAQLFGNRAQRKALNNRMYDVIELAAEMGIKNLVFGSPKQRIKPEDMSTKAATDIALEAATKWHTHAQNTSVVIGLECNPEIYGGNWWTTQETLSDFLEHAPNKIQLTLDYGAILANKDDAHTLITKQMAKINHAHISAPFLKQPDPKLYDQKAIHLLENNGTPISLEMGRLETGLSGLDLTISSLVNS